LIEAFVALPDCWSHTAGVAVNTIFKLFDGCESNATENWNSGLIEFEVYTGICVVNELKSIFRQHFVDIRVFVCNAAANTMEFDAKSLV
jgi:hypothetical protein